MRAMHLVGVPAIRERNRASWTADDQYRWNGFLSVAISSCPSSVQRSATESTSDVGAHRMPRSSRSVTVTPGRADANKTL